MLIWVKELEHLKKFADLMLLDNGRIYKENIMKQYLEDELVKDYLYFLLNKFIITGILRAKLEKEITLEVPEQNFNSFKSLTDFMIANNTGNDQTVRTVQKELEKVEDDDLREFLKLSLLREINLGVGVTVTNKVFGKGFIPDFDVMLAEKFEKYAHTLEGKEFIITTKLDGNRCVAFYNESGAVSLITRQGLVYENLDHIEDEIRKHLSQGFVYDGELIAANPDGLTTEALYRLTTGILRTKVKEDNEEEVMEKKRSIKFHIFDSVKMVDFNNGASKEDTLSRKERVIKLITASQSDVLVNVPILYHGDDFSMIAKLLDKAVAEGEEGIMVNLADAGYECKRVKTLLKVKVFNTADVLVVGLEKGSKSFSDVMGQIKVKFIHEGKEYYSYVGSGFSLEERRLYLDKPELIVGKVVEIGYFEISSNESTGDYGLRFPTWKGIIREDKTELSDLNT